ncbi:MAG TPA: hypothetical protein VEY67_05930 [Candidatus Dormibacteraeota bacterium]|nr:hypothetical protein [Candidatus Dormibacteraeota bacterium]
MATDMTDDTKLELESATSGGMGHDVAGTVADAGRQLKERAPEVMQSSRTAIDEASRRLQGEPDEALWIGGTFSVGLGVGLFIAGAPRLLVMLAIAPALAVAATLVGRQGGQTDMGL